MAPARAGTATLLARYDHGVAKRLLDDCLERSVRSSWRGRGNWALYDGYDLVAPERAFAIANRHSDLVVPGNVHSRPLSPRQIGLEHVKNRDGDSAKSKNATLKCWRELLGMLWMAGVVDRDVDDR